MNWFRFLWRVRIGFFTGYLLEYDLVSNGFLLDFYRLPIAIWFDFYRIPLVFLCISHWNMVRFLWSTPFIGIWSYFYWVLIGFLECSLVFICYFFFYGLPIGIWSDIHGILLDFYRLLLEYGLMSSYRLFIGFLRSPLENGLLSIGFLLKYDRSDFCGVVGLLLVAQWNMVQFQWICN